MVWSRHRARRTPDGRLLVGGVALKRAGGITVKGLRFAIKERRVEPLCISDACGRHGGNRDGDQR